MLPMISRTVRVAVVAALSIGNSFSADNWVVRRDGVGPVKIGITLSQLNAVLHEKFAPEDKDEKACFYAYSAKHPHILFMIVKGRLERIEVSEAGVPTTEGIQVGDSEERARKVYGARLKVKPHAYTGPEGHYLTIRSNDGRYGIRFETEHGKITLFYAGSIEAIQYIEGCE